MAVPRTTFSTSTTRRFQKYSPAKISAASAPTRARVRLGIRVFNGPVRDGSDNRPASSVDALLFKTQSAHGPKAKVIKDWGNYERCRGDCRQFDPVSGSQDPAVRQRSLVSPHRRLTPSASPSGRGDPTC